MSATTDLARQNRDFLSRLNGGTPAPARPEKPESVPVLSPNAIVLGTLEDRAHIPLGLDLVKLLEGRALIQGISGAGKSWLLRRLLEQAWGRIQEIVIDPEGEFRSLADTLGMVHVEARHLDGTALAELGRRVREHRISLVLDLSDMDRAEQMMAVAAFFLALIECPRDFWHPTLVAIDEAHLFAPFGGEASIGTAVRKAAIGAVVDLMSRGRKRGLAGVLATQRLARLSKSVASEVHNFLIGLNTLDLDVKRAAETIGWDARKGFDRLPLLTPGHFIATGPGFTLSPVGIAVGPVQSQHRGAMPALTAPAPVTTDQARALLALDSLQDAEAAAQDGRGDSAFRAVRSFIRAKAAPLALQVWTELAKLAPDGASIPGLVQHFAVKRPDVAAALELLERYDAIETLPGTELVRVTSSMRVSS